MTAYPGVNLQHNDALQPVVVIPESAGRKVMWII